MLSIQEIHVDRSLGAELIAGGIAILPGLASRCPNPISTNPRTSDHLIPYGGVNSGRSGNPDKHGCVYPKARAELRQDMGAGKAINQRITQSQDEAGELDTARPIAAQANLTSDFRAAALAGRTPMDEVTRGLFLSPEFIKQPAAFTEIAGGQTGILKRTSQPFEVDIRRPAEFREREYFSHLRDRNSLRSSNGIRQADYCESDCSSNSLHPYALPIPSRHLGEFEGERKRLAGKGARDDAAPDWLAMMAVALFCIVSAVLLMAHGLPELPA